MKDKDRTALIIYRIEQARQAADSAKLLIDNNSYKAAVNRIYYAIFYISTALALNYSFTTSKHQQLIGWFNKTFIKPSIIDQKYGKIFKKAFDVRSSGDYGEFIEFNIEEVETLYKEMLDFIKTIEKVIQIKKN